MEQEINENLKKINTWKRIFFIIVFAVIVGLVRILLWAVVLLQIASALLTGEPNKNILNFGRTLSVYLYHILLFLTYNIEVLHFPFSDWNLTEGLELPEIKKEKEK